MGRPEERRLRVAILIKATLYKNIIETTMMNERMMVITGKLRGETLSILQTYVPHRLRPAEEKERFS